MKRPRLRTLLRSLLLLVAGAVVNVAVAWGCAARSIEVRGMNNVRVGVSTMQQQHARWQVITIRIGGAERVSSSLLSVDSSEWEHDHELYKTYPSAADVIPSWYHPTAHSTNSRTCEARGWPCLACWCEIPFSRPDVACPTNLSLGGIAVRTAPGHGSQSDLAFPLRPIWPGFAINTIFYAGVCWLLYAAPFAVRRRRRIKRGLCPACAYPVGTSDVCTECGKPVRVRPERGDGM